MKSSILIFFICLLVIFFDVVSCRKRGCIDPCAINYNADAVKDNGSCEYISNCPYKTINLSSTELDLGDANNCDLFVMNIDEDSDSLTIDLNCDGINDLSIFGESEHFWSSDDMNSDISLHSSKLSISTLHPNVFILLDSNTDSTFTYHNIDTNDFHITNLSSVSSNQAIGSVFSSIEENLYVSDMDSTKILMADDARWTFTSSLSNPNSQIVRSNYRYATYYSTEFNGNGYSYDEIVIDEYERGIIQNEKTSWIPFKIVNIEDNVKLGYLKVVPRLGSDLMMGFMSFEVSSWAIQR